MIRVLIAEDQAMFRTAIRRLLELEADLEVVAEVSRGDEVLEAARRSEAGVALVDIELPGRDGLSAVADLTRELPSCRALVVTTFGRPGFPQRAMAAGAAGFISKDASPEVLAEAIRRAAAGDKVVDAGLAATAIRPPVGGLGAQSHLRSHLEAGVLATARMPSASPPRAAGSDQALGGRVSDGFAASKGLKGSRAARTVAALRPADVCLPCGATHEHGGFGPVVRVSGSFSWRSA